MKPHHKTTFCLLTIFLGLNLSLVSATAPPAPTTAEPPDDYPTTQPSTVPEVTISRLAELQYEFVMEVHTYDKNGHLDFKEIQRNMDLMSNALSAWDLQFFKLHPELRYAAVQIIKSDPTHNRIQLTLQRKGSATTPIDEPKPTPGVGAHRIGEFAVDIIVPVDCHNKDGKLDNDKLDHTYAAYSRVIEQWNCYFMVNKHFKTLDSRVDPNCKTPGQTIFKMTTEMPASTTQP